MAAEALATTDDPGVAAAIASRVLVQADEWGLSALLAHEHLLAHAPELREPLGHLHRHTPDSGWHQRLGTLLEAAPAAYPPADPAHGLDPAQRARLHREVLRLAVVALEAGAAGDAEAGALASLRAAAAGDLSQALTAGVRAAVEAARREPAAGGDEHGVVVDPRRVADLARQAQLFTARQIRAGVAPLPPGPLSPLFLNGPDALTVGMNSRNPSAAFEIRQPRALGSGVRPECAALVTRCLHCGAALRAHGPLEWVYRDDDRMAESEDGFAGTIDGTCAVCGDGRQLRVRLTVAVSRGDSSAEITWIAVEDVHAPA